MEIQKLLLKKGFSPHLKGFDYLVEAVRLWNGDIKYSHNVTRLLYPSIAELYRTSAGSVERAIRHLIHSANINQSNSELIARIALETIINESEQI